MFASFAFVSLLHHNHHHLHHHSCTFALGNELDVTHVIVSPNVDTLIFLAPLCLDNVLTSMISLCKTISLLSQINKDMM